MLSKGPTLEGRTVKPSRRDHKELCRAALYHRMKPSAGPEYPSLEFPTGLKELDSRSAQ